MIKFLAASVVAALLVSGCYPFLYFDPYDHGRGRGYGHHRRGHHLHYQGDTRSPVGYYR
jgi:hypothetical protein